MVHQHRLSIAAGLLAWLGLSAAVIVSELPSDPAPRNDRNVFELGLELLGPSMLIFETAGVTLLAAMLGAVILSARGGRYGDADDGSRPPGLTPGGDPAGRAPDENDGEGGHHHHGGHG